MDAEEGAFKNRSRCFKVLGRVPQAHSSHLRTKWFLTERMKRVGKKTVAVDACSCACSGLAIGSLCHQIGSVSPDSFAVHCVSLGHFHQIVLHHIVSLQPGSARLLPH
jgi:hypothetical protein